MAILKFFQNRPNIFSLFIPFFLLIFYGQRYSSVFKQIREMLFFLPPSIHRGDCSTPKQQILFYPPIIAALWPNRIHRPKRPIAHLYFCLLPNLFGRMMTVVRNEPNAFPPKPVNGRGWWMDGWMNAFRTRLTVRDS